MGYIIFILISLIFSIVESPIKMLHGNGITFIKIFFLCVFEIMELFIHSIIEE